MNTNSTLPRTPHAIQAGATPAALWLIKSILSLALTATAMILPWHVGDSFARNTLTTPTWALVLVILALSIANRFLARAIAVRTPGGLRSYTRAELPQMPTAIPKLALNLAHAATLCLLGSWTLVTAVPGDHGITTGLLTFLSTAALLLGVSELLGHAIDRQFRWVQFALLAVPEMLANTFLIILASLTEPSAASTGILPAVLLVALIGVMRIFTKARPGEALDDMADAVLHHINPSPTLDSRRKAKTITRAAAITLGSLIVILWAITL